MIQGVYVLSGLILTGPFRISSTPVEMQLESFENI